MIRNGNFGTICSNSCISAANLCFDAAMTSAPFYALSEQGLMPHPLTRAYVK